MTVSRQFPKSGLQDLLISLNDISQVNSKYFILSLEHAYMFSYSQMKESALRLLLVLSSPETNAHLHIS